MTDAQSYARQIRRFCPDLRVETIRLNQGGQYNDVLIVNEGWIFRFAKVQPAVESLACELAILRAIRSHVTLAVPDPVCSQTASRQIGEVFVGYKMIPGEPLWRDTLAVIEDADALSRIAWQLATFLRELHRVPTGALPVQPPVCDSLDEWMQMYQRIRAELFGYMRPDARREVADHFESFLGDAAHAVFRPVLRHGDFGSGNILYDAERRRVSGVIDFGCAGMGDAAIDFAALSTMGEAFYRRCCGFYPEMEQARARVHFYRGTFALQEALYGVEHGDEDALRSGLEAYV